MLDDRPTDRRAVAAASRRNFFSRARTRTQPDNFSLMKVLPTHYTSNNSQEKGTIKRQMTIGDDENLMC